MRNKDVHLAFDMRHFEYQLIRLFDFNARDYYKNQNPIVKILMPRMNYAPEERPEVIRRAYPGLYQLATPMLFDKYVDFIDLYAGVQDQEREELYRAIVEKKEETAMLAQYIKKKGFNEGMEKGIQQGVCGGPPFEKVLRSVPHVEPERL